MTAASFLFDQHVTEHKTEHSWNTCFIIHKNKNEIKNPTQQNPENVHIRAARLIHKIYPSAPKTDVFQTGSQLVKCTKEE